MELRFTRNSLLNTVLRDARENPAYRIETTRRRADQGRTTTISRIERGPDSPASDATADWMPPWQGGAGEYVRTDNASDTDIHLQRMIERPVAAVRWAKVQAVFVYADWEKPVSAYMRTKGFMSRRRLFVAADGQVYKWVMGIHTCLLKRCTAKGKCGMGDDAIVARLHRPVFGFRKKTRHLWLEIAGSAAHVLDEIVMTFLWVELWRRDREEGLRGGIHLETGEKFI